MCDKSVKTLTKGERQEPPPAPHPHTETRVFFYPKMLLFLLVNKCWYMMLMVIMA